MVDNGKTVIIKIKRQASPQAQPYWEEFSLPRKAGMNVISAMMDIAANPVTRDGKPSRPITYDSNCLEEVCGSWRPCRPWRPLSVSSASRDATNNAKAALRPPCESAIGRAPRPWEVATRAPFRGGSLPSRGD